jgi:gliding motility-associated protein GldE
MLLAYSLLSINMFSSSLTGDLLIVLILLLMSALFSSSEVAFFSLRPSQLEDIRESQHNFRNKIILHLLEQPKKLIATILISNTFVNIAIIIFSSLIFVDSGISDNNPVLAFLIQVIAVTFIITLFGEVIPKVFAAHSNLRILSVMAYPVYLVGKILTPLSVPLVKSTTLFDKILKKKRTDVSLDELTHAIEITSDEESPPEEKRILKGIVRFGNIDAKQIMRPLPDMVAFSIQLSFKELLQKVTEAGYSRVPVYEGSVDHIKGVLHIKDLLAHIKKENYDWQQLIRKTYFIPESKRINDLLQEFQQRKIHMAIVVDEFGATQGLLTLEDILEEIVGEIKDEFDDEEPVYTRIDENTFVFEAKTALNEVCRIVELNPDIFEDVDGEKDTLAGLLLELNQSIPRVGEVISYKNLQFTIEAADRRKIKRVKLSISKENQS